MTVRLHIDRLIVDRSLIGATDPRDIGDALETELARLTLKGCIAPLHDREAVSAEAPLVLHTHGTFSERLARTLYDGLPALRSRNAHGWQGSGKRTSP